MKAFLTGGLALLAGLFMMPVSAEAGPSARAYGSCNRCGTTIYAYPTLIGYDNCRRPVYRYVPRAHSCSSNHGRYQHSRGYQDYRNSQNCPPNYHPGYYPSQRSGGSVTFHFGSRR